MVVPVAVLLSAWSAHSLEDDCLHGGVAADAAEVDALVPVVVGAAGLVVQIGVGERTALQHVVLPVAAVFIVTVWVPSRAARAKSHLWPNHCVGTTRLKCFDLFYLICVAGGDYSIVASPPDAVFHRHLDCSLLRSLSMGQCDTSREEQQDCCWCHLAQIDADTAFQCLAYKVLFSNILGLIACADYESDNRFAHLTE